MLKIQKNLCRYLKPNKFIFVILTTVWSIKYIPICKWILSASHYIKVICSFGKPIKFKNLYFKRMQTNAIRKVKTEKKHHKVIKIQYCRQNKRKIFIFLYSNKSKSEDNDWNFSFILIVSKINQAVIKYNNIYRWYRFNKHYFRSQILSKAKI